MAGISRNSVIRSCILPLALSLVFLSAGQSFSQDEDTRKGPKHILGAKAGQNFSWINMDPGIQQNIMTGPVLGISYNYMSQHFAGVLIEAQYIKYGWEEVFLDSMSTYSRELSYLELPILTNFIIGKKKTHLKFQAGFKIAMILEDVENSDVAEEFTQYYNGRPVDDRFELGLAFGIALSQVFPIGELQLDARYNAGLSNVFDPAEDISDLLYSQNQSATISIYYWFKVK